MNTPRYAHVTDATLSAGELLRALVRPGSVGQAEAEIGGRMARQAIVFASARGAIAAALACLDEGEQVALPGYTCIAVPNAALSSGRSFEFVDVEDNGLVAATAWPAGATVLTQDTYGYPAALPQDRVVVHDASHRADRIEAEGATVAVTSFEDSKSLSAGQGGLAVTTDADLAARMRAWRDGHNARPARTHLLVTMLLTAAGRLLYHGRLPRLRAAVQYAAAVLAPARVSGQSLAEREGTGVDAELLGRPARGVPSLIVSQMRRMTAIAARRREIVSLYDRAAGVERDPLPLVRYPMTVESRADFEAAFAERGWIMDSHWFNSPLHPRGAETARYGYSRGDLPHAEKLGDAIVNLPTHPLVSDDDARELIEIALAAGARPLAAEAVQRHG